MAKILVIHGPNLNLLGERETKLYGSHSLQQINESLFGLGQELGHAIECYQSNAEHELINSIQSAKKTHTDFIIINPAAYTHTSVALRDALLAVNIPFIEIHLSNIKAREAFRSHSYLSDIAIGVIFGLGPQGYNLALRAADTYLSLPTGRK